MTLSPERFVLMKIGRLAFLTPAIVLLVAIVAACTTGTPTPTPAPPTPSATPTSTPTVTPTPTNTPTPLPPTPTPTATNTPTPTATPTPTPPPSINDGIAIAERAMVKLTVGSRNWSGVMVGSDGTILTTSKPLGASPLVTFRTHDGTTGQAWVHGRDDTLDIALLRVINPSKQFDTVEVALLDPPARAEELVMLHYRTASTTPERVSTGVVGSRQDSGTGVDYIQMQGFSGGIEHGGGVFDSLGRLRGLRMDAQNMVDIGIGRTGEAWAMSSFGLASAQVPRLESGFVVITAVDGTCTTIGAPPPIPAIFRGDLTIGGSAAPVGTRVYAKVTRTATGAELWFSQEITNEGRYFMTISICDTAFNNGPLRFWHDAVESPTTSTYIPGDIKVLDVTFP